MAGGRPREFDVDVALDAAVEVFHVHGFASASLSKLTAAMGINRPSLYAAFGDKAQLFESAVLRYIEATQPLFAALRDEPDAARAFDRLLVSLAWAFTEPGRPRGCLVVTCRAAGFDPPETHALATFEAAMADAILSRLRRARAEGQLPARADLDATARFFRGQLDALSSLARAGHTRQDLIATARVAAGVLRPPAGPGDAA